MREILFRAKRVDNGEWVYGDYFRMHCMGDVEHCISAKPFMLTDDEDFDNPPYEVVVETVGEYTGLKDKNGTKIFEGDMVIAHSASTGHATVFCVKHNDNRAYFGFGEKTHGYIYTFDELLEKRLGDEITFVVVGNIHDMGVEA